MTRTRRRIAWTASSRTRSSMSSDLWCTSRLRFIGPVSIAELRIAEAGADGERSPALDVSHERLPAEALDDGVVMENDARLIFSDARNLLAQSERQVETVAVPFAWQVGGAPLDRAVRGDQSGATDADKRGEPQLFLFRARDQLLEHVDELPDDILAADVLPLCMLPTFQLPDRC